MLPGSIAEHVRLLLVNFQESLIVVPIIIMDTHKSQNNYFKSPLLCLNVKGHLSGDTLIKKSSRRPGLKT